MEHLIPPTPNNKIIQVLDLDEISPTHTREIKKE